MAALVPSCRVFRFPATPSVARANKGALFLPGALFARQRAPGTHRIRRTLPAIDGSTFFLCIHLQSARSLLLHSPLYLLVVDRFSVRSVHPSSQLMSAYSPTLFGYEKACGVWRRRQRRKSGTIIRPRRWCISRREIRTSFFFNLALSKRLEGAGDSRESDSRRHIICQGRGETYFFPLESHKSLVFL